MSKSKKSTGVSVPGGSTSKPNAKSSALIKAIQQEIALMSSEQLAVFYAIVTLMANKQNK